MVSLAYAIARPRRVFWTSYFKQLRPRLPLWLRGGMASAYRP